MTLIASIAASAAVLLWRPTGRWWARRRLGVGGPPLTGSPMPPPLAVMLLAGAGVAMLVPWAGGPRLVLAGVVVGIGGFALGQVRSVRQRARTRHQQVEVLAALGLIAAELRAGALPVRALGSVAGSVPPLAPAARAAELGGDVPGALRGASSAPGCGLLRELGGAWHVAERSGAPLVDVIERLEQTARVDRDIGREVEAGVAPARATGRLMAVLPAMGLLLGSGVGGDPIGVLTGTWIGVACLAAGSALACGGVAWIERIATSVDERP